MLPFVSGFFSSSAMALREDAEDEDEEDEEDEDATLIAGDFERSGIDPAGPEEAAEEEESAAGSTSVAITTLTAEAGLVCDTGSTGIGTSGKSTPIGAPPLAVVDAAPAERPA